MHMHGKKFSVQSKAEAEAESEAEAGSGNLESVTRRTVIMLLSVIVSHTIMFK